MVGPANRNDDLLLADTLDGLAARRPPRLALVQHLCLTSAATMPARGMRRRGQEVHNRSRSEEARGHRSELNRARRRVVGKAHAWLNRIRRLLVRWERKMATHAA